MAKLGLMPLRRLCCWSGGVAACGQIHVLLLLLLIVIVICHLAWILEVSTNLSAFLWNVNMIVLCSWFSRNTLSSLTWLCNFWKQKRILYINYGSSWPFPSKQQEVLLAVYVVYRCSATFKCFQSGSPSCSIECHSFLRKWLSGVLPVWVWPIL